ncbi:nucleotidyltransferase family protein [Thioalkalivibrio nitratireducens]|uniref:nucleotidyltransferase family protein n=1 Tax=Thioalkalivibrio nitratireducens TaxID=186931 RepID=UPI0005C259D9|nr:nucleotidyltransferase family protein [Thioalkalivibrio nitratireducens]
MTARCDTRDDVLRILKQSRDELRALGVRRVGLFGSFRRGDAQSASDVDLLVEFEPGEKTFDHFLALSGLLEEAMQRPVDLVTPEALSPHVGPHILREVEYVPLVA